MESRVYHGIRPRARESPTTSRGAREGSGRFRAQWDRGGCSELGRLSFAIVKIVSWNVNGLRACAKTHFRDWFGRSDADVVLIQELRAEPDQIPPDLVEIPGYRSIFFRVPRLLEELALARASGVYASLLGKLARIDVLVLDDFLLNPMNDTERRDLLEVMEDRYDKSSTVIATQMPTKTWHESLGDPTIADAICDRLVHNAHVLKLGGPSLRRKKALETLPQ